MYSNYTNYRCGEQCGYCRVANLLSYTSTKHFGDLLTKSYCKKTKGVHCLSGHSVELSSVDMLSCCLLLRSFQAQSRVVQGISC